ncbi:MAG: ATP phosphoribosyltransferase regulatory subunit [Mogibacterium sp.]|nr:ATP phosphoribosyltransferase regulatory subunit [Mogibacterium sp.]MBR2539823.1 ATP phosphoribosyltransferase regulatory subunit [Mogibacterium sp.]
MQYDQSVLTRTERRIFALRTLYSRAGYRSYRMRKFEDYDLYSRYKDYLLSDRVITFTDTNGRLKALKPDVTLSIVRNIKDKPDELQRLYYDENVYRVSGSTNTFKEIMQMGLECIGNANNPSVTEVLDLAEKSLALVCDGRDYILKVSDLDITIPLVEAMTDSKTARAELFRLAGEKNVHGIISLCKDYEIEEQAYMPLVRLLGLYGEPEDVLPQLDEILKGTPAEAEVEELRDVLRDFDDDRHLVLDFSITGDTNYYNGIAFEGYIEGLPECVLVGGRYDRLMQRMKKKSRAIGFAVYMDSLAMLGR